MDTVVRQTTGHLLAWLKWPHEENSGRLHVTRSQTYNYSTTGLMQLYQLQMCGSLIRGWLEIVNDGQRKPNDPQKPTKTEGYQEHRTGSIATEIPVGSFQNMKQGMWTTPRW